MKRIFTLLCLLFLINQAVSAQCNPAFTFTVNQETAYFTASSTLPGILHQWYFGDGTQGYGRVTNHSYSHPGAYTVKHIVYDSVSTCRDSSVQTVTINFTPFCHASFYLQTDSVNYDYWYNFISNSVYSGTGIQNYTWRVNGVVQNVHQYSSAIRIRLLPGTYTVCLSIITNSGCHSSFCDTIIVPQPCGYSPTFSTIADANNRRRISFTPWPNQTTLRYLWNFGDGNSSSARLPVHTYSYHGVYSVKLIIRDTLTNCLDTVRQSITVHGTAADSCTASYSYTLNNYGLAAFTASSNQPITAQRWRIYKFSTGDSVIINAMNPVYQFLDTGSYLVCARLITNTGCVRTSCQIIYVGSVSGRYATEISGYPNPVTSGNISMNVNIGMAGHIDTRVFDMTGNLMYQARSHGQAGANIITIPVERLNRGQYFVEICYRYKIKRSIFQKL